MKQQKTQASKQSPLVDRGMKYKGHLITYKCGMYWALGTCFKTLPAAKKQIDK
jgi:hypothetical protein